MYLVRLLIFILVVLGLAVFTTQILLPILSGRPIFPFFRKESKLISELQHIRQEKEELRLQEVIEMEKKALVKPIINQETKSNDTPAA